MPAPAPPEVVDAALYAVAEGRTNADAARIAGVSRTAVGDWRSRWADRAERMRLLAGIKWTKNVLRAADSVSSALVVSATDPTSRNQPQAARVLLEGARMVGGGNMVVNGDLSIDASVNVSADVRVLVAQSTSAAELRAKAEELRAKLGF